MTERVTLTHAFTFEAAHLLPRLPASHKCRRLHGHSFRAEVLVAGEIDPTLGWLIDYATIKEATEPVRAALDHYYLNEVPGLENPTSEMIAIWIWRRLAPVLPGLVEVRVHETCNNGCSYRGP